MKIHILWLIPAAQFGAFVGALAISLCHIAGQADEAMMREAAKFKHEKKEG